MLRNIMVSVTRNVAEYVGIPVPPNPSSSGGIAGMLRYRYQHSQYRSNLQEQREEHEQQVQQEEPPADGGMSWTDLFGQSDG